MKPNTNQKNAGQGAPLARYAATKRVGDFIFFSGVIAVNPKKKIIVQGFDDIPAEVADAIGRTGQFSADFKQQAILSQSWYVLNSIRQHIEQQGGKMSDVFKLVQYFKNLDHFPLFSQVRDQFFPGEPPISTIVEVSAMLPSEDILIEVEATAYLPLTSL
ncbi:RidA family protein [Psychromonas sp.]|jgi:enamine deaminase RidA (YjgF/YER057c/UK114 family)|uniref:RidA family protein n=1 Tax=Psychromonas sp. TaxID=1884585 RepID=UPI003A9823A7